MRALALVALALLLVTGTPAQAQRGYDRQKVVYHLNADDNRTLTMVLFNIQNHISAVGRDKIDLVLVMHGNGVGLLQKAGTDLAMQARIHELKQLGMRQRVCQATLRNKQLDYSRDLFDVAPEDLVPSGVAELARLQQQGYVYVKP